MPRGKPSEHRKEAEEVFFPSAWTDELKGNLRTSAAPEKSSEEKSPRVLEAEKRFRGLGQA
jgi:hypothetical protein